MKNSPFNYMMTYWGDSKAKTVKSISYQPDQLTAIYFWT